MTNDNQTMSHLEAIDKLDELRILIKKMHKKIIRLIEKQCFKL